MNTLDGLMCCSGECVGKDCPWSSATEIGQQIDCDIYLDESECPHCGGEGWIYECDGDQSDWQEDTFCGSDDSIINCRHCGGKGFIK